MLSSREDDLKTLQQDNSRLSSHSKNLDVCFSSLKEEKDKIVESLSQMVFIFLILFTFKFVHSYLDFNINCIQIDKPIVGFTTFLDVFYNTVFSFLHQNLEI